MARNVALIMKAAQGGTWQAAAWWLERRHPTDWSTGQHRAALMEAERMREAAAQAPPARSLLDYIEDHGPEAIERELQRYRRLRGDPDVP